MVSSLPSNVHKHGAQRGENESAARVVVAFCHGALAGPRGFDSAMSRCSWHPLSQAEVSRRAFRQNILRENWRRWTGIVPPHWEGEWVDAVEQIGDEEALAMTLRLSQEEGIFAGISSGANVVGAIRLAEKLGSDAVIVTPAADTGFKYMSVEPYTSL